MKLRHIFKFWDDVERKILNSDYLLLGFDFDGTLAPIVRKPELAGIPLEVQRCFQSLLSFERVSIAVLSGRSLLDLDRRMNFPGIVLAGDHGLKIRMADGEEYLPVDSISADAIVKLAGDISADVKRFQGVQVDLKEFSLTVHYRNVELNIGRDLEEILAEIIKRTPFRLSPGRMCWEIKPAVEWDKGRAFQWISDRLKLSQADTFQLFVGDDRTDEDVFKFMRDYGFPILVVSEEKISNTYAKYKLNSQEEVLDLLNRLIVTVSNYRPIITN